MKLSHTRIKICGITEPELAYKTASAGANYIGLVFHPLSKRHVSFDMLMEIVLASKEGGASPVAVLVNQSANEMHDICSEYKINIAQCHGESAIQASKDLPGTIVRIIALKLNTQGYIENEHSLGLSNFDKERDYVLFDNQNSGSGQLINTQHIEQLSTSFKYFVAGGLNYHNVNDIIDRMHPYAVDLSSGVEDKKYEKQLHLIQQFINTVHTRSTSNV